MLTAPLPGALCPSGWADTRSRLPAALRVGRSPGEGKLLLLQALLLSPLEPQPRGQSWGGQGASLSSRTLGILLGTSYKNSPDNFRGSHPYKSKSNNSQPPPRGAVQATPPFSHLCRSLNSLLPTVWWEQNLSPPPETDE